MKAFRRKVAYVQAKKVYEEKQRQKEEAQLKRTKTKIEINIRTGGMTFKDALVTASVSAIKQENAFKLAE